MAGPTKKGTSDRADEVTLARKGAKSRKRITGLRSKTTKARTHIDRLRAANADLKKKLAEALEQQTATSEVLRVISSSPGELQPVFETMLKNATRICEAKFGTLNVCEGDVFRIVAMHGVPPAVAKKNQGEGVLPNGGDGPQSSGPSDMAEAGFRVACHAQRQGRAGTDRLDGDQARSSTNDDPRSLQVWRDRGQK